MPASLITGWGKCLPPAVLSNADLEGLTDTSDEWITTRSGIKERRISHVETSDLAAVAARHALAAAGRGAEEIDLLLVATCTPDRLVPAAAALVQQKIGAARAAAMDLNAACSGFLYGLAVADQMIRAGSVRRALVIGAEKLHFFLDFTDRATSVLFGDGAGAVVVEASEEAGGLLAFELGADGTAAEILCIPGSGTEGEPSRERRSRVQMEGPAVFRRAVEAMGDASLRVLEKAGVSLEEVDLLIPHQANLRIIEATARRLGLDGSKVMLNLADYGNTSAASIPIALAEALEQGKVRPGALVVFAAFGGGLTWAAAAYRWGARVTPLAASAASLAPVGRSGRELLEPNVLLYGKGV
ncbi:MAG: ketoacyl-ACP synthase III [Acidimicrobiia bacterium]|nr:ketoacyl-ACP synthase III [Acidimicrobiia bacterium]